MARLEALPHIVTAYAQAVLADDILAGYLVKRACQRHLHDLKRAQRRRADIWFDEAEASRAIQFFQRLKHSKGRWRGRRLILGPWQCFIIGSIYGWKKAPRKADGLTPDLSAVPETWPRRFRTAHGELPRKNGKSTLGAGVGLKGLAADREGAPEVYAAATKKDQARIVWDEARRMAKGSAALSRRMDIRAHSLHYISNDGVFLPLGADSDSLDGLNPSTSVIDELHAHKNRMVFDLLDTATASRRQPLLFCITTAGDGTVTNSIYAEQHEYARQVLEGFDKRAGLKDDSFFAYIATIDEGDDWTDPACWGKANPNLGVSIPASELHRALIQAKAMPSRQLSFKRLYLNIRTSSLSTAIPVEIWDKGGEAFDESLLHGRACHGALDISSVRDLSAFAMVFPPTDEDPFWRWLVRSFLVGADIDERERKEKLPYRLYAEAGFLTITDGNTMDQKAIRRQVQADADIFDIRSIGFDEWNARALVQLLKDDDGLDMYLMRQGMRTMNVPTKEFEDQVFAEQLRHGGNPLLRAQLQGLIFRHDANMNYMPDKQKSRLHIDSLMAGIMALGRCLVAAQEPDLDALIKSGRALM